MRADPIAKRLASSAIARDSSMHWSAQKRRQHLREMLATWIEQGLNRQDLLDALCERLGKSKSTLYVYFTEKSGKDITAIDLDLLRYEEHLFGLAGKRATNARARLMSSEIAKKSAMHWDADRRRKTFEKLVNGWVAEGLDRPELLRRVCDRLGVAIGRVYHWMTESTGSTIPGLSLDLLRYEELLAAK